MPLSAPPPDSIAGLDPEALAALAADGRLPPVDAWHPAHCGDSGMRILADGRWLHEGAPIARPALVRLFSTILRGEPDGGFVLVTPVERLSIAVDDAPFVAIEMTGHGEGDARHLAFRTSVGDVVVAGADHPLAIEDRGHGPHPYLRVRGRLDALVARPVYYELAEAALAGPRGPEGAIGVWSDGAFFALDGGEDAA